MSPKPLLGLALVTLVVTLAAVVAVLLEPHAGPLPAADEPAFPALHDDPQAVARITIAATGQETVLERAGDDWVVANRNGYPAATQEVRDLVIGLLDMRLIEPKTTRIDRMGRLDLQSLDTEGSAARRVRLEDAEGEVLVDVLVGKGRNRLTGTEPAGTYIRQPGEAQAWLTSGRVEPSSQPGDWLAREIIGVPAEQVQAVAVAPPNGPAYRFVRTAADQPFELSGLQAGEALAEAADPAELAQTLTGVEVQDVQRAGEISWPEAEWRLRLTTFDGLEIGLRLALQDDRSWLQVADVVAEDGAAPELTARAEAIRGRTSGWAYQIPQQVYEEAARARANWLAAPGGS